MGKSYNEKCADYEDSYRAHPSLYKFNACVIALFGYLCNIAPFWPFVLFVIIAFSSFIFPVILNYIGIIALFAYLFIKMQLDNETYEKTWKKLYPKYHTIRGVKVTAKEYPLLYNYIKETCGKLSVTIPGEIYISGDTTSLITIRPLLKFTPFIKFVLCVSFYDLYGMNNEQFQIKMTNTLANFTNFGRFANWLQYLMSKRVEMLEVIKEGTKPYIGYNFMDYHCETLSAITGVLMRWNIVNTDNITVNNYNAGKTGEALIASLMIEKVSEINYWDEINNTLGKTELPPESPYTELKEILRNRKIIDKADEIIKEDLAKKTRLDDNTLHIFDRLEVMSYFAAREGGITSIAERLSDKPENIAADLYITNNEDKMISMLNASWYEWAELLWTIEYNKQKAMDDFRKELESKMKEHTMTMYEKWEYILILSQKNEHDKLMKKLQQFYTDYPSNVTVNMALGSELLKNNNPEGLSYIEKAISFDPEIEIKGLDTIINFHQENGREMEADLYIKRLREGIPVLNKAITERNNDITKYKFLHHELSDDWIEKINRQLSDFPNIKDAYMVKADLKYLKERPVYLFFYSLKDGLTNAEIIESLDILSKNLYLPPVTNIYITNRNTEYNSKINKINNIKIYSSVQEPVVGH